MNCAYDDTALPASSRRDRQYCTNNCSALASYYRRKAGRLPPPKWQHPALLSSDPVLRAAAMGAQQLGEAHRWDRSSTRCVLNGLATVLAGRLAGERVPLSAVRTRTHRHVPKPRLAEVLADLDLLDDDTTPVIRVWIDRNTSDLAPGFAEPVRGWLLVLLDGDARSTPGSHGTLYAYFGSVRVPRRLGQGIQPSPGSHQDRHLRRARSASGPPAQQRRLRPADAFRLAKRRGLIFTNPTIGLKARCVDPT